MKSMQVTGILLAMAVFAMPSYAQRGGGGMGCQRGGGGSPGNAAGNNGGGFLANAALLNQMVAMNQAASRNRPPGPQNRFNNSNNPGARNNRPQPTAEQFVRAAMRFDRNADQQLDQAEIAQVANAIVTEMQRRRPRPPTSFARSSRSRRSSSSTITGGSLQKNPTTEQMEEAFAERAMTFDADGNGNLNSAETQRLATAFLRTLR